MSHRFDASPVRINSLITMNKFDIFRVIKRENFCLPKHPRHSVKISQFASHALLNFDDVKVAEFSTWQKPLQKLELTQARNLFEWKGLCDVIVFELIRSRYLCTKASQSSELWPWNKQMISEWTEKYSAIHFVWRSKRYWSSKFEFVHIFSWLKW